MGGTRQCCGAIKMLWCGKTRKNVTQVFQAVAFGGLRVGI